MDLYIYYRVPLHHAAAFHLRAARMQRQLSHEYGIVTGLKYRSEQGNDEQTWMEIYQAVPSGFEAILERAVAQAALSELIDGERHTEYFVDASSCA